jgi:hypothetical protein
LVGIYGTTEVVPFHDGLEPHDSLKPIHCEIPQ